MAAMELPKPKTKNIGTEIIKVINDSFSSLCFIEQDNQSYLQQGASAVDMTEKLWRGKKLRRIRNIW